MTATHELTIETQHLETEGVVMVKVHGALDTQTYCTLESKLDRLINHGEAKLMLDLSGVDYITMAGVRVFVTARLKATREHGGIVLLRISEQVANVLDMLQLGGAGGVLRIANTEEEALKLLETPQE